MFLVVLAGAATLALAAHNAGFSLAVNIGQSLPGTVFLCQELFYERALSPGTIVKFTPPEDVQALLTKIAPQGSWHLPWLKRVVAEAPVKVCWDAQAHTTTVDGAAPLPTPLLTEYPLPARTGCSTLGADELFLAGDHRQSFDSRYFGGVKRERISAICMPVL